MLRPPRFDSAALRNQLFIDPLVVFVERSLVRFVSRRVVCRYGTSLVRTYSLCGGKHVTFKHVFGTRL